MECILTGQVKSNFTQEDADQRYIKISEKGASSGVASLDGTGKIPASQLPEMNYDPAGSAQAVQQNLTAHTENKNNPHEVTAEQVGSYTKEQTASDEVISLYGLESDDTPNDIFLLLYKQLKMINEGLAEVTIIAKTQNGNSLKGILLPDLKDSEGKNVYTDDSGKATFFAKGGTTVKIAFSNYGDIEDFTESFTVNSGEIITKEIALKVRNFFRVTSTQNIRFTKNTSRVDVSVGGGGGGAGRTGKQSSGDPYRSAGGGGGGYTKSQDNVEFVADTTYYTATVGAGGAVDEKGGTSSFIGVSAQGGEPGQGSFSSSSDVEGGQGNGNGADGVSSTFSSSVEVSGNAGRSGTNTIFNSFESSTSYGGGGGSGSLKRPGRYDSIDGGRGGSPGGGDGGDAAQNNEKNGKNGIDGTGGGGGSAGIWYDEGTANFGTPGVGGSGVVTMRMHLISA